MKIFQITFLVVFSLLVLFTLGTAKAVSQNIVIAEVQVGGSGIGTTSQELVSIYNNADEEVDITDWCVQYSSASNGVIFTDIACFKPPSTQVRLILPSHNYAVVASNELISLESNAEYVVDATFSGGKISGVSGHIRIVDTAGTEIDKVGYDGGFGSSSLALSPEGNAALFTPNVTDNRVFQRTGETIKQDTDDNLLDFTQMPMISLPASGLYEAVDICPNIDGRQTEMPADHYLNAVGDCEIQPDNESSCLGVIISEILPNPAGADGGKEFIELHNTTSENVALEGCKLEYGSDTFEFSDEELKPGEYRALYDNLTGITLVNSSKGIVYLADNDNNEIAAEYPAGLDDDVAWALFDTGWAETFTPTPNLANELLKFKPCPEGKVRNPETNICVNIAGPAAGLVPCSPGQKRNPDTNRCRNIASLSSVLKACKPGQKRNPETNRCRGTASSASALKPCAADQVRNPATNRCKKIESSSLKPCKENQERNPETNRCRNVAGVLGSGDINGTVKDIQAPPASTQGIILAAGSVIGALLYGFWEWRNEALIGLMNLKKKFGV